MGALLVGVDLIIPRDYKGPPLATTVHGAYCKKSEFMPDFQFAAIKELVEQQVVSYRCSGASLVKALCI